MKGSDMKLLSPQGALKGKSKILKRRENLQSTEL